MVLDNLARQSENLADRAAYLQPLVDRIQDGMLWEYRGEILEDASGKAACVCGHPIRYIFPIYRKDASDQCGLGSTCIGHFESINPEMYAALTAADTALKARIADAQKRAREAARQQKVEVARAEFRALYDRAHSQYAAYAEHGRRAPRPLWEVCASRNWYVPENAPDYTRAADLIRWYQKQTAILNAHLSQL